MKYSNEGNFNFTENIKNNNNNINYNNSQNEMWAIQK